MVKPGTSPRMRGKPSGESQIMPNRRNIPAYAGKTTRSRQCLRSWTEHPRVCGENACGYPRGQRGAGTSPRMRGKLLRLKSTFCLTREHPRVCGENSVIDIRISLREGTSPRMRGKLKRFPLSTFLQRNIPAYAGKTNSMCKTLLIR